MSGVCLVGSGWAINVQIPALRQAGLKIVALVGRSAAKTAALAAQHSVPFATASLAEALLRPDVEIVSIVTPPATHCDYALQVLAAGKHLLTEKPFALNAAEARRMRQAHADACSKLSRPLLALVDHELRFHSSVRDVKSWIASGAFGRISYASLTFLGSMSPVLESEWNWWSDREQFGGALGAIGSHYTDLLSFITTTRVSRVQCSLRTIIARKQDPAAAAGVTKAVTSDDTAEFRLQHHSLTAADSQSSKQAGDASTAAAPHQSFQSSVTLMAAAYGVVRNELILLSDRGALVANMSNLEFTFTPADRQHRKGFAAAAASSSSSAAAPSSASSSSSAAASLTPRVWTSDAPDVAESKILSPYTRGTVLLGQRLQTAITQLKESQTAAASSVSAASSSARLTDFPPALAGIGASFDDAVHVQCVLDAARLSHEKHNGGWVDVTSSD